MRNNLPRSFRVSFRLTLASLVLGCTAMLGCSDSSSPSGGGGGGGGSTTWSGTIADVAGSGTIDLIFASAVAAPRYAPSGIMLASAPVNATGTIKRSGVADVAITGAVDNGVLTFSGGGYDGTGTLGSGKSHGTFTGPNGAGAFNALPSTSTAPVASFCGVFTGTSGVAVGDAGQWTITVGGTAVTGTAFSDNGDVIPLDGSASGKNVTIGATSVDGSATATGAINAAGDQISGTYTLKLPDGTAVGGGTWGGTSCGG